MSLNVLVVEDELDFREYLKHAIPWRQYDLRLVGAVPDVEPARSILDAKQVDLVLLDITLQTSNGLDLIEHIKTLVHRPRVVVITGHGEFETVRHALRLGVDDYLLKPFAKQELLMSVLANREQVLTQRREDQARTSLQEAIVDSWLYQLTHAQTPEEGRKLHGLLARYGIRVPDPPRVVLSCSLGEPTGSNQDSDRRLGNVVDAWATTVEQNTAIAWLGLDSRVYVVMGGMEPSELAWDARDTAREFVKHTKRYLGVQLLIGMSEVTGAGCGQGGTSELLSVSARQALSAQRRATDGEPVVIWRSEFDERDLEELRGRSGATPQPENDTLFSWHRMAMRFIDRYHHDPTLDVQTVAAHFGVSTEYLRRIFRRCAGTTCVRAIAQRRVEHAQQLLTRDSLTVAEVANRSGFRDPAHFSRVFKRTTGASPAEFRRGARTYDPGWS